MARPYSRPYSRRLPLPPPYIELHRRPLLGSKVNREGNSVAHGGEPSTRPRGCAASAVPGLPLTHEDFPRLEVPREGPMPLCVMPRAVLPRSRCATRSGSIQRRSCSCWLPPLHPLAFCGSRARPSSPTTACSAQVVGSSPRSYHADCVASRGWRRQGASSKQLTKVLHTPGRMG
jgi:hypothetical protein